MSIERMMEGYGVRASDYKNQIDEVDVLLAHSRPVPNSPTRYLRVEEWQDTIKPYTESVEIVDAAVEEGVLRYECRADVVWEQEGDRMRPSEPWYFAGEFPHAALPEMPTLRDELRYKLNVNLSPQELLEETNQAVKSAEETLKQVDREQYDRSRDNFERVHEELETVDLRHMMIISKDRDPVIRYKMAVEDWEEALLDEEKSPASGFTRMLPRYTGSLYEALSMLYDTELDMMNPVREQE